MPRALEALDHVVRRLEHGELSALEAIDAQENRLVFARQRQGRSSIAGNFESSGVPSPPEPSSRCLRN
ncbi:hypothetical protein RGR602_PB00419 (plasmid) [Rhizobium gallicum bv. gallicum R602sp]|uniref:Uncharacterized protein n=1 Tax=Rhizobium gallicum bv. gallicum R602sp TaxID=1041138 RepID=A0A0B4X7I3_9HYPH|nr:hypothetical protein RGR602_PB00419 [Rhizobium gallicum bv. gallicum R602sp]